MRGSRRILHIGKYFPPFAGGMEHYLRDLMVAQRAAGLDSRALVHRSELGLRSLDEVIDVGGQSLPLTRAAVWARLLFTPVSPTFPLLLVRLLRRERPGVLHLHMPNVSVFWCLFLPAARALPWVVHWHADVLASRHSLGLRVFYHLYRPFERAILKRASAIVATSPPYLESSTPLREFRHKCRVVPLGLGPVAAGGGPPATIGLDSPGTLRVLAVGRLTYYKGFEYLLRACARLPDVELELVGEGDQASSLRQLAESLDISHRVRFHGHLPAAQLEQRFAACDCLCLPSIERTEAFGMVLLEAMQRGRAAVASGVSGSGMGWVVDHGVTGLVVQPGSVDELAAALGTLQSDRDKIQRFGESGREKFEREFGIDRSAAQLESIYDALWADHGAAGSSTPR